jgi:curved DNA-binding protein CbpA
MTGPADGRTWYQVMGLPPTASGPEIRAAYLRLARNLHPDRHLTATATERALAERRMREVNAAWAVLGDTSARASYDVELRLAERARASAGNAGPTSSGPRRSAGGSPRAGTGGSPRPGSGAGPGPTLRPTPGRPVHHRFDGVPLDDGEPDEVELSRGQMFLLRRAPVLLAIAIAIGIFIGSAYAGARDDSPPPGRYVTTTTLLRSDD